jgi:hypothetical protein
MVSYACMEMSQWNYFVQLIYTNKRERKKFLKTQYKQPLLFTSSVTLANYLLSQSQFIHLFNGDNNKV